MKPLFVFQLMLSGMFIADSIMLPKTHLGISFEELATVYIGAALEVLLFSRIVSFIRSWRNRHEPH